MNALSVYRDQMWTDTGKHGALASLRRRLCRSAPGHCQDGVHSFPVGADSLSSWLFDPVTTRKLGGGCQASPASFHSRIARRPTLISGLSDRRLVRCPPSERAAIHSLRRVMRSRLQFHRIGYQLPGYVSDPFEAHFVVLSWSHVPTTGTWTNQRTNNWVSKPKRRRP